jgi:hypothetical protein
MGKHVLLGIVLVAMAMTGSARAQTHVHCDAWAPGESTCRDSEGEIFHVHSDQFGTTVRDSEGRTTHIQDDGLGGSTIRTPDGDVVHARPDGLGNTIYRDQHGNMRRCHATPSAALPPLPPLPGQTTVPDVDCQ